MRYELHHNIPLLRAEVEHHGALLFGGGRQSHAVKLGTVLQLDAALEELLFDNLQRLSLRKHNRRIDGHAAEAAPPFAADGNGCKRTDIR